MTELVMGWFQAVWGREALRRRCEALEEKYTRTLALAKQVIEVNKAQADAIAKMENQDGELREQLSQALMSSRFIDVNAKCPVCGHTKGHLRHEKQVENGQVVRVVPVNCCEVCGTEFRSGGPVAGEDVAARSYQLATEVTQYAERARLNA